MKTSPVIRMTIGSETLEFSSEQIISAKLLEESDPISVELPISQLSYRLFIPELTGALEIFSIFNEDDLGDFIPVLAYEIVGESTLPLGKFFLTDKDSWKTITEKDFSFVADDLIGALDKTPFDGVFWETPVTVAYALSVVLAGFPTDYTLDSSLSAVEISGYIPRGTCRDALKQILFAAGATVSTARSTKMNIAPFALPDKLYDARLLVGDKDHAQPIERAPLVTSIEVVSHTYTEGTDPETIFEQYLEPRAEPYKVPFDKPYFDIQIDGPGYTPELFVTGDGEYIVTGDGENIEVGGEYEFGPNAIYLNVSEAGLVTIIGTPWVDSQRSFVFVEDGEFANENTVQVSNATLVNNDNVESVLVRLRDYYRQRYYQNITIFPEKQVKPREILLNNTLYGKKILGQIRKVESDLTAGFFAVTDVFGIQPDYALPIANPYRRPRCGISVCGTGIMRQNGWREYA